MPLFAGETLQQWYARRGPRGDGHRGTVMLWPDTFSNYFHPHVGQAAVEVLESGGLAGVDPGRAGLLRADLDLHRPARHRQADPPADRRARWPPHVRAGGYVVGLEPSCTAVFRSDAA